VLSVIVVALVGSLVWFYVNAVAQIEPLDANLCPRAGPVAQTIVLVDASDVLPPLVREDLLTRLSDLTSHISKGERLDVWALSADGDRSDEIASLCNPGDGSDLGEVTANPERAKRRWETGFVQPVTAALNKAARENAIAQSPIMAALQKLSVARLTSEADRRIETTLIIISDMLENTPDFSMYRSGVSYAAFRASNAFRKFETDLAGADVELWLVQRPGADVTNELVDFWNTWVADAHGSVAKVIKLKGMN
jgi:hypothetical protein